MRDVIFLLSNFVYYISFHIVDEKSSDSHETLIKPNSGNATGKCTGNSETQGINRAVGIT